MLCANVKRLFLSSMVTMVVAKPQTDPKGRDHFVQTRPLYEGCVNIPNWIDIDNEGCDMYTSYNWCTYDGVAGSSWNLQYGQISDYAIGKVSAFEACCGCGGGTKDISTVTSSTQRSTASSSTSSTTTATTTTTTTSSTSTTTGVHTSSTEAASELDCELITCGRLCNGECGWSQQLDKCVLGGSQKSMFWDRGTGCPDCAAITCGVDCRFPCGWKATASACRLSGVTTVNEYSMGRDCPDCNGIKCPGDCVDKCGWDANSSTCEIGLVTSQIHLDMPCASVSSSTTTPFVSSSTSTTDPSLEPTGIVEIEPAIKQTVVTQKETSKGETVTPTEISSSCELAVDSQDNCLAKNCCHDNAELQSLMRESICPKTCCGVICDDAGADHGVTSTTTQAPELVCVDKPADWMDSYNEDCNSYAIRNYCADAAGPASGWDMGWGSFDEWVKEGGVSASLACCECGGGEFVAVTNPAITTTSTTTTTAAKSIRTAATNTESPWASGVTLYFKGNSQILADTLVLLELRQLLADEILRVTKQPVASIAIDVSSSSQKILVRVTFSSFSSIKSGIVDVIKWMATSPALTVNGETFQASGSTNGVVGVAKPGSYTTIESATVNVSDSVFQKSSSGGSSTATESVVTVIVVLVVVGLVVTGIVVYRKKKTTATNDKLPHTKPESVPGMFWDGDGTKLGGPTFGTMGGTKLANPKTTLRSDETLDDLQDPGRVEHSNRIQDLWRSKHVSGGTDFSEGSTIVPGLPVNDGMAKPSKTPGSRV